MCSPFAGRVSWYMLNWFICSQFFSSFWFAQFLGAIHEKVQHHHHLDVSGLINPRLIGGDTILGDQHQLQTSSRIASYIPKLPWFNHCIRTSITPSMVQICDFIRYLLPWFPGGCLIWTQDTIYLEVFMSPNCWLFDEYWSVQVLMFRFEVQSFIYTHYIYIYDQHN